MIDRRALRRLGSALRSGLRGLRAAPLVFVVSVATMSAGLLLLSAYLLVVQNMREVLASFGQELRVVAYVRDASAADVDGLRNELGALEGVSAVRYVSPEQALERLRRDLGDEADVLEGLGRNPLPGSFELELEPEHRSPGAVDALVTAVLAAKDIDDVRYGRDWVEGYARVVRSAQWIGLVLGLFLALVLASIAAGTVRLALHSRYDEIQIQRLVGAGGTFIRLPFLLEAAVQGAIAAAAALGVLYGLYELGLPLLREPLAYLLGPSELTFFSAAQVSALLLLGVGLGLAGAGLSLARLEERA